MTDYATRHNPYNPRAATDTIMDRNHRALMKLIRDHIPEGTLLRNIAELLNPIIWYSNQPIEYSGETGELVRVLHMIASTIHHPDYDAYLREGRRLHRDHFGDDGRAVPNSNLDPNRFDRPGDPP